ncbi:hypothetical protein HJC23_001908 [Cyclotella cryptica]|uniref:Uncharacterized protein n=1 Tax=Cyclotella cryptica TaxID=29204 RepID=A0ABD3NYB4_9STRA
MKLTSIVVTALSSVRICSAIYLACCETNRECPTQYDTIDTYVKGEETLNACCYPEEEPNLNDLPECIHPSLTEDGVGISLMSIMETTNSTEATVEVVAANAADNLSNNSNTTEANNCCGAGAAIQPALRSASLVSVCPLNMNNIDGAIYLDGETSMQVCCDGVRQADELNTEGLLPCPVTTDNEPSNTTADEGDSVQGEHETDGADAIHSEEAKNESCSPTAIHTVAFGIALTSVAIQVAL